MQRLLLFFTGYFITRNLAIMLYLHFPKRIGFCAYTVFSTLRGLVQGIFLGQTQQV